MLINGRFLTKEEAYDSYRDQMADEGKEPLPEGEWFVAFVAGSEESAERGSATFSAPVEYKVYIWDDVLVDYTPGIMFAVAQSVEEARELLQTGSITMDSDLQQEPKVYAMSDKPFRAVWGGG